MDNSAALSVSSAKEIVMKKWPDAEVDAFMQESSVFYTITTIRPGTKFQRMRIADNEITEDAAWISAAQRIQSERKEKT